LGISEYYGTYNGWVVVRVDIPVAGGERIVTIGGYEFSLISPAGVKLLDRHNRRFYYKATGSKKWV